jgi:hypothetical protein
MNQDRYKFCMAASPKAEEKIAGPLIGRKKQTHFAGAPSKGFGNCRRSGRQINSVNVVILFN